VPRDAETAIDATMPTLVYANDASPKPDSGADTLGTDLSTPVRLMDQFEESVLEEEAVTPPSGTGADSLLPVKDVPPEPVTTESVIKIDLTAGVLGLDSGLKEAQSVLAWQRSASVNG